MTTQMPKKNLITDLQAIIDSDSVKIDSESLQVYGCDWTTAFKLNPSVIVFPKTIEQVLALVKWANINRQALVPSGGRTGLSGGAVASNGEIVVSLERMNQILDFNALEQTVACQPGVILENLQNFAKQQNLFYPIDLASKGSCQIGGNIATNAGGLHVIRYGSTRNWILGLKVITGNGELLELNHGLIKNATGYDLLQLFIGSEGTLGIIVEAIIKLTFPPLSSSVMVLGIEKLDNALKVLEEFRKHQIELLAFEFFSEKALEHVIKHMNLPRPFTNKLPFYLLIEFENPSENIFANALRVFDAATVAGWVSDGVISQNETQARNLWQLRENITVSIAEYKPFKNDLSVNVSYLPNFIDQLEKIIANSDLEQILFGHIGDGNIHVNILKPSSLSMEDFHKQCLLLNQKIMGLVWKVHGSVSAEHGIGLLKKDYLMFTRSAKEIELMRSIKGIFDPNHIMNPGKIF
jgi:glycolate oxidase subunit GlcD